MEKGNEIVFAWAGKAEESQRITSELCWHSGSVSSALAVPTPGTAQKGRAVPVLYPSQWLSDDGGALSGLKTNQENKPVLHWRVNARLTSASTQPSPSESKTGAEEPNTSSRTPQACSTLELIIPTRIWWYKDLVQVEPWPSPPTGTRPHTPGPEFCLWTPNRQQHVRDEGLS